MVRPKDVVNQWVDAFNSHDAEAITSLYHSNAENHQVANEPAVGIDAIREMFTSEFASADMTAIVENIFEDGQWAILEWRDPLGLRGCGFFQVVNGKILFQRGYWDKLSFLKQHNLPSSKIFSTIAVISAAANSAANISLIASFPSTGSFAT